MAVEMVNGHGNLCYAFFCPRVLTLVRLHHRQLDFLSYLPNTLPNPKRTPAVLRDKITFAV